MQVEPVLTLTTASADDIMQLNDMLFRVPLVNMTYAGLITQIEYEHFDAVIGAAGGKTIGFAVYQIKDEICTIYAMYAVNYVLKFKDFFKDYLRGQGATKARAFRKGYDKAFGKLFDAELIYTYYEGDL